GFQFSFSVITAIALLNRPILGWMRPLTEPDPFMPEVLLNKSQRAALGLRRWLAGAVAISMVSWVGSLPLTLRHFHLATPVALVANVLLVPVAFFILFTSILIFAAALVHLPLIPLWLGNANWCFARVAISLAQAFAFIPGGNFYLDIPEVRLQAPVELTVLRLRAGGGAQHLRTVNADWLFDCGSARDYDFLQKSYLNAAGVNRLQGLVLSHADSEHIGAAPFVVRDYHPEHILLSALETSSRSSSLRNLRNIGVQTGKLSLGDRLEIGGGIVPSRAEVLFPPASLRVAHADDRPLVLRLDVGEFRVLWCNDAGFTAEKYIVEKLPPDAARCDVVIRNQHASDTSFTPEFVDRAGPRVVISANHSFPDVQKLPQRIRDTCASRRITLLDQAETGAVTLRFWPQRLEVVPFRGGTSPLLFAPQGRAK
ncbi:MAG TPA: ComEC/Rec2 family competence protein, partial [Verrucomicrobiaceae bacterium]